MSISVKVVMISTDTAGMDTITLSITIHSMTAIRPIPMVLMKPGAKMKEGKSASRSNVRSVDSLKKENIAVSRNRTKKIIGLHDMKQIIMFQ